MHLGGTSHTPSWIAVWNHYHTTGKAAIQWNHRITKSWLTPGTPRSKPTKSRIVFKGGSDYVLGWRFFFFFFFPKEIIKLKRGKGKEVASGCFSGRVRDKTWILNPCAAPSIWAELHRVLSSVRRAKPGNMPAKHWEEASAKRRRKGESASCCWKGK